MSSWCRVCLMLTLAGHGLSSLFRSPICTMYMYVREQPQITSAVNACLPAEAHIHVFLSANDLSLVWMPSSRSPNRPIGSSQLHFASNYDTWHFASWVDKDHVCRWALLDFGSVDGLCDDLLQGRNQMCLGDEEDAREMLRCMLPRPMGMWWHTLDVTNKLTVCNLRQTLPRTLEPSIEFFIYVD